METLTEFQKKALEFAPYEWFRADFPSDHDEFALKVRRPEYTAELLQKKGYLETRVVRNLNGWLYREYRRCK